MTIPNELQRYGFKATLPRIRILRIFHAHQAKHVSADEIHSILQSERLDIGLPTVYRVLTQFTAARILIRSHFNSGAALYELNEGSDHDHIICTYCGTVEEFVDIGMEYRRRKIAESLGFTLQTHTLSLYGVCKKCRRIIHSSKSPL